MHLILSGATGLIGSGVLHHMLAAENITRVSILSRRPVPMADGHEKVKVIIHKDFNTYSDELLGQLKDAQGVVWSLGVSQNAVNKTEYYDITHEYTLSAAKAFSTLHPESNFNFVFVSGEGATQKPGMFTPLFGRVKGETEADLYEFHKKTPNFAVYNVRPAGVNWLEHPEIHPFIPQLPYYRKALLPVIDTLYKPMITHTRPLGRILTELAASKGAPLEGKDIEMNGRLLPNAAIRRMSEL